VSSARKPWSNLGKAPRLRFSVYFLGRCVIQSVDFLGVVKSVGFWGDGFFARPAPIPCFSKMRLEGSLTPMRARFWLTHLAKQDFGQSVFPSRILLLQVSCFWGNLIQYYMTKSYSNLYTKVYLCSG
jgi:hypothetical protein